MRETEIRDRIHDAFGDAGYPHDLTRRIASHLGDPPPRQGPSQLLGLVAFIVALAIIGTLVLVRIQSSATPLPAVTPPSHPSPQAGPVAPSGHIPQADLDRAQLSTSGDMVTPLDLTSTNNGRTVSLIGAYADHARTVLFFRTMPDAGFPMVEIDDDTGFLNAGSSAGAGIVADSYFVLDTGPHAGTDGAAHLKVTVRGFNAPGNGPQFEQGNWTFSFSIPLQSTVGLPLDPPLTTVGTWKVTIEAMEVTSTLIHFQAVFDGAAVEDITENTVTLADQSGSPLTPTSYEAGTTVPKSQIGSVPPRNTRINVTWARPSTAADLTLTITGGGAQYRGVLHVAAPPVPTPSKGGGSVFLPTIYPSATEDLRLEGAFSAAIFNGNPNSCGAGSGPDRIMIYSFGVWFQVDQLWYLMIFNTDKAVGPYKGPGTYPVKADIYPYVAATGIGDPIFSGTVQLTVTDDRYPGPQKGTVSGTLTWTGAATHAYTTKVSGSWSCMFSQETGPA